METCSERRKRKLLELAQEKGGLKVIATDCGLSYGSLDQIKKGVPLPAKADGTRSERSLGDDVARAIEKRYNLERGWFDSDEIPAAEAGSPTLAQAFEVLVAALQAADKDKLIAVRGWLSAMAEDPATAKNKSDLILKLLVTDADKPDLQPHHGARGTRISLTTPRLGFGGEGHGKSDTNAAKGGGEK